MKKLWQRGFTLVEVLVGAAVFLIITVAAYQAYSSLFILNNLNQYKILALNLANEQFEIARNLSYGNVGEVSGIPNGKIPHVQNLSRGGVPFIVITTVRNIDLPFDGTIGGAPNDLSPADNKLVEVEVECPTCKNFTAITLSTNVSPRNLETASTNGALFVKVFDASGEAVQDANVHIVNSSATTTITIDDVTDINGMLQIVDVPPGVNAYAVSVSKPGYSSDRTYPPGQVGNPNPSVPDATVVLQQLTQVSFSIDRLSTLSFSSNSPTCAPVANLDFSLKGSKVIGSSVPKYSQSLSTGSVGTYTNNSMEWDTYSILGIDSAYDIAGINPLNPFALNPGSIQNVELAVVPKNPKTLLVTVKDSSTYLPVTGATVVVTNGGGYSSTATTDRGSVNQTDWSGGGGQATSSDQTKYFSDDGNIDTGSPNGEIKLKNVFGNYNPAGTLESSTVDVGDGGIFHNLVWLPTDEPLATGAQSAKFQFASNADITATTTWNFKGPDGSSATFYSTANSNINPIHNGDRYVRYKVFLSTVTSTSTPNISDMAFTYTASCTPPGQVAFSGLATDDYVVTVSKAGYTTKIQTVSVTAGWMEQEIILSP